MNWEIIGSAAVGYALSLSLVYFLTNRKANRRLEEFNSIRHALNETNQQRVDATSALQQVQEQLEKARKEFVNLDASTKDLQVLRDNSQALEAELEKNQKALAEIERLIESHNESVKEKERQLDQIMAHVDLYSRVEEFVAYGHYETPEYIYETSERFAAEIKSIRIKQKEMIKADSAFIKEGEVELTGDARIDKKIIDGQLKLIMRAFNIECDLLIGKVKPSSLERTLSRIEKLANDLEKMVASLRCGISLEYVKLKYEECGLQYQFTLKKKEEQEEQRLIREQMREEARAEKEYRDALAAAEREEKLYRDLLEQAKKALEESTSEERALAEARIAELEYQLAEAEAKEQRAKSLAEQTKRGHVYVISNIGSFGEDIYKIGMTRRLDPLDRVKELGDASVPFPFDIHAIIYSDNAPSMEAELHRKFTHNRVNAVNLRKEFFQVSLDRIAKAVTEIDGEEANFQTTIVAEEYYESKRLREQNESGKGTLIV